MSIIKIDTADLPSGLYELEFEVPTYADYTKARIIYEKASYDIEDLLLASKLKRIKDTTKGDQFYEFLDDIKPINRLLPFPIGDRLALIDIFRSFLFVDDEIRGSLDTEIKVLKQEYKEIYTLSANLFSIKKQSIQLRTPTSGFQFQLENTYATNLETGFTSVGLTIEEVLAAFSISAIDGKPVSPDFNAIDFVKSLSVLDFQILVYIFFQLFDITKVQSQKAKKLGASKRDQFISSIISKGKPSMKISGAKTQEPEA